jgi:hypothetical protein
VPSLLPHSSIQSLMVPGRPNGVKTADHAIVSSLRLASSLMAEVNIWLMDNETLGGNVDVTLKTI